MKTTLGGDRIGTGAGMSVQTHDYERSTFNLDRLFMTTLAPGVVIPFLNEIQLKGSTADIKLKHFLNTLPTESQFYSSYKLQCEIYKTPIRLYNRQMHNVKFDIGMHMERIKFPMLSIEGGTIDFTTGGDYNQQQIASNSLLAYTGTRGLGKQASKQQTTVIRRRNAMQALQYYDIIGHYHANKQEGRAFVLGKSDNTIIGTLEHVEVLDARTNTVLYSGNGTDGEGIELPLNCVITARFNKPVPEDGLKFAYLSPTGLQWVNLSIFQWDDIIRRYPVEGEYYLIFGGLRQSGIGSTVDAENFTFKTDDSAIIAGTLNLLEFPLSNIDEMRERILAHPNTTPLYIDETEELLPYRAITGTYTDGEGKVQSNSKVNMAGLCVKTYQSDMFNNWLSKAWVDEVNQLTSVDTSAGFFTMNALSLAEKNYDIMNDIMATGGTSDDWEQAVYGEKTHRRPEIPMYIGGMSAEVMFNQVVSTATSGSEPLGTLGGHGNLQNSSGGTIHANFDEASMVMGVVSLTPRLIYSQGNDWYGELETMDDLHKPGLDGIGFQNLPTEWMAAWDTTVNGAGIAEMKAAGMQPAWIEYMTSIPRSYGEFADMNKAMFMVADRQYEADENGNIADMTTYIDPAKFNSQFAYARIDAQNFFLGIEIEYKARRKMSYKVMPRVC